jgi:hypothetical protein
MTFLILLVTKMVQLLIKSNKLTGLNDWLTPAVTEIRALSRTAQVKRLQHPLLFVGTRALSSLLHGAFNTYFSLILSMLS